MNAQIFKMYLEGMKKHLEHAQMLGIMYTPESVADQIKLINEMYDLFNLEAVILEAELQ